MSLNVPDEIARAIRERETFLLSTHLGADGDAIGSLLALRRILVSLNKQADAVHIEGVPPPIAFLPAADVVRTAPSLKSYDACILVDCGDIKRIALPEGSLHRCQIVIDIDHHDPGRAFGDIRWVVPQACATGELIYDLAQLMGAEIDSITAACLYAAIAMDTGGFRFSNTTARSLRICADLVEHDAQPEPLMKHAFHERSMPMLKLMGRALICATSEFDGQLVWSKLTRQDYTLSQASDADTEGVIDLLRTARGCRISALFRITERGRSKASLRSEPPFDVSAIAAQFGGGGHAYAAGFSSPRPLDEIVDETLQELRRLLKESSEL